MKKLLAALIILTGLAVCASDLVIESKTQTYSEAEGKIKFDGDVKVKIDDLSVTGTSADISIDSKNKPDTATFYDKPYAVEVKKNKKREVKANILKVSLITKIVRAEGDTQSVVFDGKVHFSSDSAKRLNRESRFMRARLSRCLMWRVSSRTI